MEGAADMPGLSDSHHSEPGRWRALFLVALALTVLHIALNGYAFGGCTVRRPGTSPSSDHANVLPWVYWYRDSGLFSRDFYIQMGAGYQTVLWPFVAAVAPAHGIEWTFFVLYVAALAGLFAVILRFRRLWSDSTVVGVLAAALFMIVRVSPAGEPTYDAALYTRSVGLPLALGGLLLLARGRGVAGFGLILAALCVHSLTAFHASAIAVPLWLMTRGVRARRRWGVLAGFVACAAVIAKLMSGASAGRLGAPSEEWLALQHVTNAGHIFIREWGEGAWREFAVCALVLLPALTSPANAVQWRLAVAAMTGGAALTLAGWLTTGPMPSMLMMQLVPVRGLKLVMVLSMLIGAEWIVRVVRMHSRADNERRTDGWVIGAAALMLFGLFARQNYLAVVGFTGAAALSADVGWRRAGVVAGLGVLAWFAYVDVAGHAWSGATRGMIGLTMCLVGGAWLVVVFARERAYVGIVLTAVSVLSIASTVWTRDPETTYAAFDFPMRRIDNDWTDVQRWAVAHTAKDALFLVPPWLEGFRTYSRRSIFVDWKTGGMSLFSEPFGHEWGARMAALLPRSLSPNAFDNIARNYDELTAAEIRGLAEAYGISYVVTRRPQPELPYAEVYSNRAFHVLATSKTGVPTSLAPWSHPPR